MEFSRQEYWCGLPFPSPGDLPDPAIEPVSPALQMDSLPLSYWEAHGQTVKAPHFLCFFPSLPPCLFPLILSDLEMHLSPTVKCVITSALLPVPISGEFNEVKSLSHV